MDEPAGMTSEPGVGEISARNLVGSHAAIDVLRWSGVSQASARREAVRREALRNMPLEFRERLHERERIPPAAARLRMLTTQFVVIAIVAWIGRRILRLRLKR